jgi:phage portal protein BeeE
LGLLNWLRGEDVVGRDETRSIIKPDRGEVQLSGVGLPTVWSGTRYWNLEPVEALAIADVWSCVRVLADTVSSLPLHVYRKTERGRQRVTSGRLVELLEHPAPGVSEADLTSTLMTHLAIWGNGYLGKLRGPDGQVAQLTLLHPDRVQPEARRRPAQVPLRPAKGRSAAAHRGRRGPRQGPLRGRSGRPQRGQPGSPRARLERLARQACDELLRVGDAPARGGCAPRRRAEP